MGDSFYWIPIAKRGKHLDVAARSAFRAAMERCFGDFPIELGSEDDVHKLSGMRAAMPSEAAVFDEIMGAIADHGSIRLTVEG